GDLSRFANACTATSPAAVTREAAFAHAITAAGVSHAVARACRQAAVDSDEAGRDGSRPAGAACGCSTALRPNNLPRDWLWGGCGDDLLFGYTFARTFVDARETEGSHPRRSDRLARALMNLHNNEAGRRAVFNAAEVACKCHGLSGSCSLRTCWQQLGQFSRTGDRLLTLYTAAERVRLDARRGTKLRRLRGRRRGSRKPDGAGLVFLTESPDYCLPDSNRGLPGTRGRRCWLDRPNGGPHSCLSLCCGRGFESRLFTTAEKCDCRFKWCCRVRCDWCPVTRLVHLCK
uniref:Protein Wnt n=1 Tax=Macrostomum lignano TaxID=282301 RepID=A0A1I8GLK8_9PLAT